MRNWERVLYAVVNPDDSLGDTVSEALDELNVSVSTFSERSGVSESLLYKITAGHRENIELRTFRRIITEVKRIEQGRREDERAVAIISNRESLEQVSSRLMVDEVEVTVREYPCSTVEEAFRQSILAERDGVDAIICGPITAYTIENIVHTPVIGLDILTEQMERAIERAVQKTIALDA